MAATQGPPGSFSSTTGVRNLFPNEYGKPTRVDDPTFNGYVYWRVSGLTVGDKYVFDSLLTIPIAPDPDKGTWIDLVSIGGTAYQGKTTWVATSTSVVVGVSGYYYSSSQGTSRPGFYGVLRVSEGVRDSDWIQDPAHDIVFVGLAKRAAGGDDYAPPAVPHEYEDFPAERVYAWGAMNGPATDLGAGFHTRFRWAQRWGGPWPQHVPDAALLAWHSLGVYGDHGGVFSADFKHADTIYDEYPGPPGGIPSGPSTQRLRSGYTGIGYRYEATSWLPLTSRSIEVHAYGNTSRARVTDTVAWRVNPIGTFESDAEVIERLAADDESVTGIEYQNAEVEITKVRVLNVHGATRLPAWNNNGDITYEDIAYKTHILPFRSDDGKWGPYFINDPGVNMYSREGWTYGGSTGDIREWSSRCVELPIDQWVNVTDLYIEGRNNFDAFGKAPNGAAIGWELLISRIPLSVFSPSGYPGDLPTTAEGSLTVTRLVEVYGTDWMITVVPAPYRLIRTPVIPDASPVYGGGGWKVGSL